MKRSSLYSIIRSSLLDIDEPRLFQTERGYQGQLQAQLANRIHGELLTAQDLLVESEYQKSMRRHGLRIRPDLVIHVPYERGETPTRRDGNYAAIELKLRARAAAAHDAFGNLDEILTKLNYHVGIFINIASAETHFAECGSPHWKRIRAFAVRREGEYVVVREEWAV